jgi:hypothetical protein
MARWDHECGCHAQTFRFHNVVVVARHKELEMMVVMVMEMAVNRILLLLLQLI